MKTWLLRWLGAVPISAFEDLRAIIRDEYRALISQLKIEHEAAITELIQELNNLRNSIPSAAALTPTRPVRVFRNFREFRTAVEGIPPKIRIERIP